MTHTAQASLFPAKRPSAQGPWLLPSGWEWMPLGELCKAIVGGGTPDRGNPRYWEGNILWASVKDLKSDELASTQESITPEGLENSAARVVEPGTIVLATRMGLGKVCIAQTRLAINQDLKGLTLRSNVLSQYVVFFLKSRVSDIEGRGTGATVKGIKLEELRAWPVPVPFPQDHPRSLDIQRRIVARIEALLVELKEARVLAAAIRSDTNRIMEAALKEVFPPSEETLPLDWRLSTIEEIRLSDRDPVQTGPFGAQLKSKEFVEAGVPVVAIGNVQWGELDTKGLHYVTETKAKQLVRYKLEPGDILFTRMGTVGRSCVVPQFADGWLMTYHLIRIAVDLRKAISRFIFYCFRGSPTVAEQIRQKGKGATREGVNSEILRKLRLPLPPLKVQQEIVDHLDATQAEVDEMRCLQAQDVELLDRLGQSILERAFRGEL